MLKDSLKFNGTWRNYQKRVLDHADLYLADGRIHIVAAPGSGKTTLGIELIRRVNKPALVLAPSITIREQWIERIKSGFMKTGNTEECRLSQNIKEPGIITAITYQALHSAVNRHKGKLKETAPDDEAIDIEGTDIKILDREAADPADKMVSEEVDFSSFDLLKTVKEAGIEVICLDECHHLRSEWWKALESFMKDTGKQIIIISLTATPPYDSTPSMWARYIELCGDIDEEITVPELVKEGSLCPHQDYVYFNYPTKEEKESLKQYEIKALEIFRFLMEDEEFARVIGSNQGMKEPENAGERFLDKPEYLSALLIFYNQKRISYNPYFLKLLGTKKLPAMNLKWMEKLLQGFLYEDTEAYFCDKVYLQEIENKCRHAGIIHKRKVCLSLNDKLEQMLISSKGKIESIKQIVRSEYKSMGKSLRMLILTDYIKKEYLKSVGDETKDTQALGVIPFFEILRRDHNPDIKLGVLCGSVVIIPESAKEGLNAAIGTDKTVVYTELLSNLDTGYVLAAAPGNSHFLTSAVTRIFMEGRILVLIGTKSLLGEGWDAPCINSLILASFVGSYMLSNQMRGRAIRTWKEDPDKVSNIWHLVCMKEVKLLKESGSDDSIRYSEDYLLLERRMENFLGLDYREDSIESGIGRLSVIKEPFTAGCVDTMNKKMLLLSSERNQLKERWQKAVEVYTKMEIASEAEISTKGRDFTLVLFNALGCTTLSLTLTILMFALFPGVMSLTGNLLTKGAVLLLAIAGSVVTSCYGGKLIMLMMPLKHLEGIGKGMVKAMEKCGMLSDNRVKAESEQAAGLLFAVGLKGGSVRDRELFARNMSELFDPVDNQRYLLVNSKRKKSMNSYFCVPEVFSKKKEDVSLFAECLKPYLGYLEPVYTRTPEGRQLLLKGRVYAFANRQERCVTKKKVKSALL